MISVTEMLKADLPQTAQAMVVEEDGFINHVSNVGFTAGRTTAPAEGGRTPMPSTPPMLPSTPSLHSLPSQPASSQVPPNRRTISDVTFIVVSVEEGKPVKPDGIDIDVDHWVEMPCPKDHIVGGYATKGKVYSGPLKVFLWAFQGAEDHQYLCEHYSDDLKDWVRSKHCLVGLLFFISLN